MVDKGCDNCYYTYFDEKAYPCSLCIRGVERTDKWQPSRKTKNSSEKPNNSTTEDCSTVDLATAWWNKERSSE